MNAVLVWTSVLAAAAGALAAVPPGIAAFQHPDRPAYLGWSARDAESVGRAARANGRVGSALDLRMLRTERSYNYKLRATWLTPDVIRATARLRQLTQRLDDARTEALVRQAEAAVNGTAVLVEIDPREGSGVIPQDWLALLAPVGGPDSPVGVQGTIVPALREIPALAGVFRRDYAYDVFWVVFPLVTEAGRPLFPDTVAEADLIVRIHDKEGRVRWRVPESVRARQAAARVETVAVPNTRHQKRW